MTNKERAKELLDQMTLEEKITQIIGVSPRELDESDFSVKELAEQFPNGIGAVQMLGHRRGVDETLKRINQIQDYCVNHTRLGIPAMIHEECLNGHVAQGATYFPRPIAMGGSFNPELVQKCFRVAGKEARAKGGTQCFTPVLDTARDPRFGRFEECFGEDPYLISKMGISAVRGLQGADNHVTLDGLAATVKHFVGYGESTGGRNFAYTDISKRKLMTELLYPFEKTIKEAKPLGVMPAHGDVDGVMCHGNTWLLDELLRQEWGFDGIITCDYNDVRRLYTLHHVAKDLAEAIKQGLLAGVDIDVPEGSAYKHVALLLEREPEMIEYVNRAVLRVLDIKYRIGLMDHPFIDVEKSKKLVHCEEHLNLSLKMAEESIILLENRNKTLPLCQDKLERVAVIGPLSDPVEFGYYSTQPNEGISILDGLKSAFGDKVTYEQGCGITKKYNVLANETQKVQFNGELYTEEEEMDKIDAAIKLAEKSDIVILCIGGNSMTECEAGGETSKKWGDRADLQLVGQQELLFKKLKATGKKVVVVLMGGKPLSCAYVYDNADAVLMGWMLGTHTGTAIANVLIGKANPSAKLPVTIGRGAGYLPVYYCQPKLNFLKGYLFSESGPLYPFGYGLSYTQFDYTNLNTDGKTVKVTVTNTGDTEGAEVVQMYLHHEYATVTHPDMLLKAFEKVSLAPNESKEIVFQITDEMLETLDIDYNKVIVNGEYEARVGASSTNYQTVKFMVNR